MTETTRIAVLGASGYAGGELVRLLAGHLRTSVTYLGAKDSVGKSLAEAHPHLASLPIAEEPMAPIDPEAVAEAADVAFCALPNGTSASLVPSLLDAGLRVIDLAGDFRLPAEAYPEWYGFEHPAPALLEKAVYGLPELFGGQAAGAELIANPGCYALGRDPEPRAAARRRADRARSDPDRREDGPVGCRQGRERVHHLHRHRGEHPAVSGSHAPAHARDRTGARARDRRRAARAVRAAPRAGRARRAHDELRVAHGGRHDRIAHRGADGRVRRARVRPGARARRHGRLQARARHERDRAAGGRRTAHRERRSSWAPSTTS